MPRKTLTILGILLILVQIVGLPTSWKMIFGVVVGAYLVIAALRGSARENNVESEMSSKISRNEISDGVQETENGN